MLDILVTGVYIFFALRNGPGHMDWSTVACAAFPLSAAIIIHQQPRNRVGWVLAVMGLLMIFLPWTGEYAYFALVTRPGSLSWGPAASWVYTWSWTAWEILPVLGILIIPDGNPPSPRWWRLIAAFAAIDLPVVVLSMIWAWPARGLWLIAGPQGPFGPSVSPAYDQLNTVLYIAFVACLALAVVGLAVRYRRARGVERQQLKWIFLVLIAVPLANGLSIFVTPTSGPLVLSGYTVINFISVLGFPVAMIFAVTRYHLYDIDVIIRRTLLYGALTLTLGLVYFGSIILLEALLARFGLEHSQVSIVASTLFIAGLFQPLRGRFQILIDRRFYRKKYNGDKILDRFATELRSEMDLEAIYQHMLLVVNECFEPDDAALWLVTHPESREIVAKQAKLK